MIRMMTADGPGRPWRKALSISHRCLALATILAALSWSGLAQNSKKNPKDDPDAIGNRNVGKGVNFYSLEKEIAMGRELAQEVERQAKIIYDPVIAEYVNRVGQNLVRNSDAKVPFTIKVLDSEEVNAFALPGGILLRQFRSDSESGKRSGIGWRHGSRDRPRRRPARHPKRHEGGLAQIGMLAAAIAIPYGWTGYGVQQVAGLAIPMGFLAFSRANEREADYLGLQYMYQAGYDPSAFVDFFEKIETLETRKPGSVSKVFMTHPMTDDRIKASQEEIQKDLNPKPEYVLNTSEFNEVKARLTVLHGRRKVDTDSDSNGPVLRRDPGTGAAPVDSETTNTDTGERPTLKRRGAGGGN